MRRWLGWALVALALAVAPAAAEDRLDAAAAAVDRATAAPRAEAAGVERMAKLLGTTPAALRAERADARLGWGDVFIAHRIATRGGHPLAKVIAARRTGAAWGEIAEEARVSADALVQDVTAVWPVAPGDEKKGLGGKGADSPPDDKPSDRAPEEIRDKMIRGGGRTH